MRFTRIGILTFVSVFAALAGQFTCALAQENSAAKADSQAAARQKILDSDRWQQTSRQLSEWLSVQQIYTPEEVSAMREDFAKRIGTMSPNELEEFMNDMDERLQILTSPEAEEARLWLGRHLAVVRDPEGERRRLRPDVANMSASQIRHELQMFLQQRDARLQTQASFDRTRQQQLQISRDVQSSRQQVRQQAPNRSAWPANRPPQRSPYSQSRGDMRPAPMGPPLYSVSPWGNPIYWHPLYSR